MAAVPSTRSRTDRCPGALRPWPAPDGALVRVRLAGGALPTEALTALSGVAREFGDGDLHLTRRANLQLRELPSHNGALPKAVVEAIGATGLLPSRSHELVRNFMVSPLTGIVGGRCDLRPVVASLDTLVCADADLTRLPGNFLFALDDGRGDLTEKQADLGLVALDATTAQLRVGSAGWGSVVPLAEAPAALVELAQEFVRRRGTGPDAPWHVDELGSPLTGVSDRDERSRVSSPPLPYGDHGPVDHVPTPAGVVSPGLADYLAARGPELVITPWHGILVRHGEPGR